MEPHEILSGLMVHSWHENIDVFMLVEGILVQAGFGRSSHPFGQFLLLTIILHFINSSQLGTLQTGCVKSYSSGLFFFSFQNTKL